MNAAGLRRIAGNVKTGYAGHAGKCADELQIGWSEPPNSEIRWSEPRWSGV